MEYGKRQSIFPMLFTKMITTEEYKKDQRKSWKGKKEDCPQQNHRNIYQNGLKIEIIQFSFKTF